MAIPPAPAGLRFTDFRRPRTEPPNPEGTEVHRERPKREYEVEKRSLGQVLINGVLIDEGARTITISFGRRAYPDDRLVPWLAERREGWTLARHDDGLQGHFSRQDREPPESLGSLKDPWADRDEEREARKTREEVLGEITEALFGERSDPVEFARRVVAESDVTQTHPSLFVSPTDGRPAPDAAKTSFSLALQGLRANTGD